MKIVKIIESTAQVGSGILENHTFQNYIDQRIITGYKRYEMGDVPAETGLGIRYSVPISLIDDETYIIEVFAECCLSSSPIDPDVGYTDDDVIVTSGIQEQVYLEYGERGVSSGQIMTVDEFVTKHNLSTISEVILTRLLDDVEEKIDIPDELLDRYSSQWNNREIGETTIFEEFVRC